MSKRFLRITIMIVLLGPIAPAFAQAPSPRLALVISEAQYRDAPLATAANDGGLMADMLRQAGFDVTGAANLSQDQIRSSFREFLEKVAAVGPQAEVFVYLSGKGLQFAGDNYLAPVEATIANSATVPSDAVRLSDFVGPLQQLPAQARVIVLDIARPNEFGRAGQPLASGLAIVDAPDNSLVAFSAAPGTIAPNEQGPYGAYAQALVEMLRQPGLPVADAFAQIRLRVNESTRGAQTPWDVSKLSAAFALFQPAAGAPRPTIAARPSARPTLRGVPVAQAYGMAVEADTFEAYNDFVSLYPGDPLALRVRAMLAARREALTWYRTVRFNTPQAYWSYLRRYPRGPHAPDAARRLAFLSAPVAPPPQFAVVEYDVPPPPQDEIVIIDRPRFYVNEIVDVPPPPMPIGLLPPIAPEYRELPPPPPPPRAGFFLPIPIPIPIPFARPQPQPGFVTAPRFAQPVGQPGTSVPGAGGLPQGYSPPPGQGGRPPGAPGTGGPPAGAPGAGLPPRAPGQPGAPVGAPLPGATPLPGAPPSAGGSPQGLPRPPGAAGGAVPPVAPPSQALPKPGQPGVPPVPAAPPAGRVPPVPGPAGVTPSTPPPPPPVGGPPKPTAPVVAPPKPMTPPPVPGPSGTHQAVPPPPPAGAGGLAKPPSVPAAPPPTPKPVAPPPPPKTVAPPPPKPAVSPPPPPPAVPHVAPPAAPPPVRVAPPPPPVHVAPPAPPPVRVAPPAPPPVRVAPPPPPAAPAAPKPPALPHPPGAAPGGPRPPGEPPR